MTIISVIPLCTQQCGLGGLDDSLKDNFYDKLIRAVRKLREREIVATSGGFHGHVGSNAEDSEEQHTGYGYGVRIKEGGLGLTIVQLLIQQKSPSHLMRLVYHELR